MEGASQVASGAGHVGIRIWPVARDANGAALALRTSPGMDFDSTKSASTMGDDFTMTSVVGSFIAAGFPSDLLVAALGLFAILLRAFVLPAVLHPQMTAMLKHRSAGRRELATIFFVR